MGIIGDHPEGGLRFDLDRRTDAAPWVYEGSAFTPARAHPVRAVVAADGSVVVDETSLPADIAQRVVMLLRTAWKHAEGQDPPRRLRRWRAA